MSISWRSFIYPPVTGRIESVMSVLIISLLAGLSIYLGARLHAAVTEIAALQKNIAFLKRRLGQS